MTGPQIRCLTAPNPSPLTGGGTNTWLLGSTDLAVIDPGPDDRRHLAAILSAAGGGRISHILVTHAHRDHSALAPRLAALTDAPVLGFGTALSGRSALMTALAPHLPDTGEGLDLTFRPDLPLADGDTVTGADWQLHALHTPGHLGGHLCLALGTTLFTGDHVMGWSTSLVSPPDGDMADYMASLRRLQSGPWTQCLPGHGATIPDPATRLHELIAHRLARETAILAALAPGPISIGDIALQVYPDLPSPLRLAAQQNVLAHLIDLEARKAVTASPSPRPDALFSRR